MAHPGSLTSALPSSSVHLHVLTRRAPSIDLQVPCATPRRMGPPGMLRRHPDLARVRFPGAHDVRDEPRPGRPVRPLLHARRHAVRGGRERERLPVQLRVLERGSRRAGERVQLDVSSPSWRRERVLRRGAEADGVQVSELTGIGTARSWVGLGGLTDLDFFGCNVLFSTCLLDEWS